MSLFHDDTAALTRLKELEPYYRVIGEVTVHWNMAQHVIYEIFWLISGMRPEEAQSVFFSIRQDSAQRDMTLALCESSLKTTDADILASIRNGIQTLSRLAGERNAAIHTMWDVVAALHSGVLSPAKAIKYHHPSLQSDIKRQFEDLSNNLLSITLHLMEACVTYYRRKSSRETAALQSVPTKPNESGGGRQDKNKDTGLPPSPSPD